MKLHKIKNISILEQVVGGNNCSCIYRAGGYYMESADNIGTCKIACCASVCLYVAAYAWNGKVHECYGNKEDMKLFFALSRGIKK